MKPKTALCFLFFVFFSFLEAKEKSLIVPLGTKCAFSSIYIGNFSSSSSILSSTYLEDLRDILCFDLNQSGIGSVQRQTKEGEKEIAEDRRLSSSFWKTINSDFVVKICIRNSAIKTALLHVKTGLISSFASSPLEENLCTDRRIIHQIADLVVEEITGEKGVASTRILYAVQKTKSNQKKEKESEIWEADYDGHNARQLTVKNHYCISPVPFPREGKFTQNRFLYVNYKQGQSKIYSASFQNDSGTPFLPLRGNQLLPAISLQGNMIAFISDASGRADLFVQPISCDRGLIGKPIQVYSFPHSVQASPTFSPDGKKIAFVSDKEGTPRIYVIDTPYPNIQSKRSLHCLTKKYRENTSPCWSPDGTKLAYSAKINGTRQIIIYDFITKEEIQLTDSRFHKENPSFAPNSLHLIFNTADSASELFIINLKQRKALQITKGAGKKHYPCWGPYRK